MDQQIRGLKAEIMKQCSKKNFAENMNEKMMKILVESIKEVYKNDRKKAEELVWSNYGDIVWLHIDSKLIGKKTTIKPYTNKKGKTHFAHFTEGGKYYGPVSKNGTVPFAYTGYFHFYKTELWLDHTKIPTMVHLNDLLMPKKVFIQRKPVVIESDDSDCEGE